MNQPMAHIATFEVPIALTDEEIMDLVSVMENELQRIGVKPDTADGCIRITVGPAVDKPV